MKKEVQFSTGIEKPERVSGWGNQRKLINDLTIGRDDGKGHFRLYRCHGKKQKE